MKKNFQRIQKTILGLFGPLFAQIWEEINFSGKNALSVFKYSDYLASCKKSEQTDDLFLRKILN